MPEKYPSKNNIDTLLSKTKAYVDTSLNTKQNTLTAGTNISIINDEISAVDTKYTAGNGLNLSNGEFSVDTSVIQSKLTAGSNIQITTQNNTTTISATDTTYSEATYNNLGLVKLGSSTAATQPIETASSMTGRQYPVQLDSNGRASVNVPWQGGGGGSVDSMSTYQVQDAIWGELYTTKTITVNVTNGTYDGNTLAVVERPAEVVITPATGYTLPSTITVSGATYTWNNTTGKIAITNPTANITITVVCS